MRKKAKKVARPKKSRSKRIVDTRTIDQIAMKGRELGYEFKTEEPLVDAKDRKG